jgi:hypothetical protein
MQKFLVLPSNEWIVLHTNRHKIEKQPSASCKRKTNLPDSKIAKFRLSCNLREPILVHIKAAKTFILESKLNLGNSFPSQVSSVRDVVKRGKDHHVSYTDLSGVTVPMPGSWLRYSYSLLLNLGFE